MYHQQREVDQLPEELNKMPMSAHSEAKNPKKYFLEKYKVTDSMISRTTEEESNMSASSIQPPVSMQSPQQPRLPAIDEMADDNTVDDVVSRVSSMAVRSLVDHENIDQYVDNGIQIQASAPVVPKTHVKTCTHGVLDLNKYKLVTIPREAEFPLIIKNKPNHLVCSAEHHTFASDIEIDNNLRELVVYFYPEYEANANKFISDFISAVAVDKMTTEAHITNTLAKKPRLLHNNFDEEVMRVCSSCVSGTKICRHSWPVIPEEVFARNTTETEFIIHKVIAPPIKYKPQPEQIDDTKFFEIFHFDNETHLFSHPQTPQVFNYEYEKGNSTKFFAIYSQNLHLHLCKLRHVSVIRKSEFHRNVNALKLLASTKSCRVKDSKPHILIFSFEEDLYMQFPDDDFFRRNNTKENYVFRLKRTTKTSFNYVISTIETLKNVKIYGTYECEQAYLGKMGEADSVHLNVIEKIGAAVIHTNVAPKDKKIKAYSPMEYACYKAKHLSVHQQKKTMESTKHQG